MTERYTTTAIVLHWLMAILLIGLFILGLYMSDLPRSPERAALYALHKSLGVTAYCLVCLRLLWRLRHLPPALPGEMSVAMQRLAKFGHVMLYLLMLVIPLSGWLMSSAKGHQTIYFGVLPILDAIGQDKALGDTLKEAHELLNYLLAGIVLGHLGFALKHHWRDKDAVLQRMAPWIKR